MHNNMGTMIRNQDDVACIYHKCVSLMPCRRLSLVLCNECNTGVYAIQRDLLCVQDEGMLRLVVLFHWQVGLVEVKFVKRCPPVREANLSSTRGVYNSW